MSLIVTVTPAPTDNTHKHKCAKHGPTRRITTIIKIVLRHMALWGY